MRRLNSSRFDENNLLPTLRSTVLNSHVGAIEIISFVLTNTIVVAGSTSSRLYSLALFRKSVAKFKVRLYESYSFILW